ncbi:MAG: DUF4304 domain-containing protein [Pyrinomonadaceae bacterium]
MNRIAINQIMTNILNKRLNTISKNQVYMRLKDLGFRKNGAVYSRVTGGITWLIEVQRSQWNDQSELRFTLNVGVYVPGVWSTYATYEGQK